MEPIDEISSTQKTHGEILREIVRGVLKLEEKGLATLADHGVLLSKVAQGVLKIEEQGLQHLKDIASAANKFADSDELKVKLIAGKSEIIRPVLLIVITITLAFVVIFITIQGYDARAKHHEVELEIKR